MTEEIDQLISEYDTHWDGGIITKPGIISQLLDPDEEWYPDPKSIAVDSIIVYPYIDRLPIPNGTDGGGKLHIREEWFFPVHIFTHGEGTPKRSNRLEKLYEGAEDCLVKANEAGTYIYQIIGTRNASSRGPPAKWMLIVTVKMIKPNRKLST